MAELTALLGGLTFSNQPGAKYTIREIAGWFGPPPEKTNVVERPNADGAFGVDRFYRAARPITIAGLVIGEGDGFDDWLQLSAVMSAGRPDALTVIDPTGAKSSLVKIVGSGSDLQPLVNGMAQYVLSLVAFDPVKYGEPVVSSVGVPAAGGGLEYPLHADGVLEYGAVGELGRVTVENTGTAKTFPFITVLGGVADGFRISRLDTGEAVRYDRAVPDGTVVTLDFRTGTVLVDGVSDASSSVSEAQFFGVEPGLSVEVQFTPLGATSGSPLMTVELSSGWW